MTWERRVFYFNKSVKLLKWNTSSKSSLSSPALVCYHFWWCRGQNWSGHNATSTRVPCHAFLLVWWNQWLNRWFELHDNVYYMSWFSRLTDLDFFRGALLLVFSGSLQIVLAFETTTFPIKFLILGNKEPFLFLLDGWLASSDRFKYASKNFGYLQR